MMENGKYDIFISYRRKEGSGRSNVPMARTFKLEFERRGYKVFFDYSECTDNYFSETILPAIRTCDFFVLVLTEDSLTRCFNEGDWVRREIEEALANNRKIIPITPDNECNAWPKLPASLSKLDGLQITTIHTDHMFEASVDYLVKNRFHLDKVGERQKTKLEEIDSERLAKEAASITRFEEGRGKAAGKKQETTNIFNGHEYVDLGLPSGTLWATCNIGANKPEDYGDFFSWDNGKTTTKNWGNGWSVPTLDQWEELLRKTKSTWTVRNGVNGRLFTGENGESFFLPAAGNRGGDVALDGSMGFYWLRSRYANGPHCYGFGPGPDHGSFCNSRRERYTIRPVRPSR